MKERTETFTNLVAQGAVLFDNTLKQRTEALTVAIGEGAGALDKALKDRTGYFNAMIDEKAALMDRQLHDRTGQFLTAINHGAIALDRTLAERAETFTNSLFQRVKALENAIGQQTSTLDRTMTERAQAVIVALAERLQAIDSTFNHRTAETDRMLGEHARATAETFGKQTAQLNQVLANNSAIIQQTANQVGAQSREAVSVLTSQTQTLREVSRGLLEQIHGLTQRFENQGQAILTAAKALDSSNTKIDSILEGRHQSIISLLHTVNTKAQDLDNMMRSYAGMVENAMTQAEARAKQVGTALARDTSGQAQAALAQIERLREEAQAHTARAVNDLKGSFETVITQIGRQLEQMRGQFDNTSRGMREAAQQTASDLESLRQEMQRRMEALPEHTAQATAAIRKALSEQLREIEAITPVLNRPAPAPEPYRQTQAPSPAQAQFGTAVPAIRRARTADGAARRRRHRKSGGRACPATGRRLLRPAPSAARGRAVVAQSGPRPERAAAGARRRPTPARRDCARRRLPHGDGDLAALQVRRARRARTPHLQSRRPGHVRRDRAPLRPGERVPRYRRSLHRRFRAPARRGRDARSRGKHVAELPDLGIGPRLSPARACERPAALGATRKVPAVMPAKAGIQ
jgi:hypothetical protein